MTHQKAGFWVRPFHFTPEERELLSSCWKRDKAKASKFIERAEVTISRWRSLPEQAGTAPQVRDRANELRGAAQKLRERIIGMEPAALGALTAQISEHLVVDDIPPARYAALEAWQALRSHYHGYQVVDPPLLFRLDEVLDPLSEMLELIASAAEVVADRPGVKPGRKRDREKTLILWLAGDYKAVFGRMPGTSKSGKSPFLSFWDQLKTIDTMPVQSSEFTVLDVIKELRN